MNGTRLLRLQRREGTATWRITEGVKGGLHRREHVTDISKRMGKSFILGKELARAKAPKCDRVEKVQESAR